MSLFNEKFFNRTSFLRAIFVILPIGIYCLYSGVNGLFTTEEDLNKYTGIIKDIYIGETYDEVIEEYNKAFQIKLKNNKKNLKTFVGNHIDTLKNTINKGDKVVIWTNSDNLEIRQLKRNQKAIIKYDRAIFVYVLFLIIGLIFTTIAIGYLINHPEDLWGGDKEKMKQWIDDFLYHQYPGRRF